MIGNVIIHYLLCVGWVFDWEGEGGQPGGGCPGSMVQGSRLFVVSAGVVVGGHFFGGFVVGVVVFYFIYCIFNIYVVVLEAYGFHVVAGCGFGLFFGVELAQVEVQDLVALM